MSAIKKLKADPTHLNNFMSSDVKSGNNPCGGNGTSVGTKYVDWPFDSASNKDGVLTSPPQNPVKTSQLGHNSLNTGITG